MRKLLFVVALLALGWYGNQLYSQRLADRMPAEAGRQPSRLLDSSSESFQCDGRTHCSQMTSCEEATFFIRNCPDTKMDGNNDGVPCERQWCG